MSLKCEADKISAHDITSDVHDDHESESESNSAAVVDVSVVQCHFKHMFQHHTFACTASKS